MNTLLLIVELAHMLGYALTITNGLAPEQGNCHLFKDDAAIIVCVEDNAKRATIHLIKYVD